MAPRPGSLALVALAAGLVACAPATTLSEAHVSPPAGVRPFVVQNGKNPVTWTQFVPTLSCGSGQPFSSIAVGPDGNMWLADPCGGLLSLTMAGVAKERLFDGFRPTQIAVGADQKFYMTQQGTDIIGVSDTHGDLQTFTIPSGDTVFDGGIALGPDGNVWFAELLHVGKITPSGVITEYLYDRLQTEQNQYGGVTSASDGDVWVTDAPRFGLILRVDPATGNVIDVNAGCDTPGPIVPAKQPSVWRVWTYCDGGTTLSGVNEQDANVDYSVQWPIAGGVDALPQAMILGPAGDPWWASTNGVLADFEARTNTVTAFLPPDQTDTPDAIALGPDGNIWAATSNGKVDVYIIDVIKVKPSSLTFASVGQQGTLTVTERGRQTWSAKSSNTSVATVTPGNVGSQFVVTSVGDGTCTVTVRDSKRNSFAVSVTVSGSIRKRR